MEEGIGEDVGGKCDHGDSEAGEKVPEPAGANTGSEESIDKLTWTAGRVNVRSKTASTAQGRGSPERTLLAGKRLGVYAMPHGRPIGLGKGSWPGSDVHRSASDIKQLGTKA